jgi:hypothetical protein
MWTTSAYRDIDHNLGKNEVFVVPYQRTELLKNSLWIPTYQPYGMSLMSVILRKPNHIERFST